LRVLGVARQPSPVPSWIKELRKHKSGNGQVRLDGQVRVVRMVRVVRVVNGQVRVETVR